MHTLTVITGYLKDHGAWFLVVVLGFVIWRMALYIVEMHEEQRENDKVIVKILEGFKASVESLTKVVDRMANNRRGRS